MIKSMTAFSNQTIDESWGVLECEMRSVNHRYLEIQLRLPEELRRAETQLRELIQHKIGRGKVECTIRFKAKSNANNEIKIDIEKANSVLDACKLVTKKSHQSSDVNPLDILNWPGVILESTTDFKMLMNKLNELVQLTLVGFIDNRQAEGVRLEQVLKQRHQSIQRVVKEERARRSDVLKSYRGKLIERLNELKVQYDTDRLEQELVYMAQKIDVDEELDRLDSHLIEIENIFKRDEPVGRRLDFIMQELNREANTLASKSTDIKTTQASVELKVLTEQMREQVQNIE